MLCWRFQALYHIGGHLPFYAFTYVTTFSNAMFYSTWRQLLQKQRPTETNVNQEFLTWLKQPKLLQSPRCMLFTVIHNYGNPYEKWNIFFARPHLWPQLGTVKPEIMLCETMLNLYTLNTLTCCSSFVKCASYLQSFVNGVRRCVCSWNNQHPFHRAWRKS